MSSNAFKPFSVGLAASVAFFVGYIIFGLQGWGTPSAVEQAVGEVSRWCERVQPGIFHEPVNALSNLGFMISGLLMFSILLCDDWACQNFCISSGMTDSLTLCRVLS